MSLLVQKALENIREYYDQGITLEEIAEKLHVTEEYSEHSVSKRDGTDIYRDDPWVPD